MATDGTADPVQLAVVELLGLSDMYRRMQDACWSRCIAGVKNEYLEAGESNCIDRCVNKYTAVHSSLGKQLQEAAGGERN